MPASLPLTSEQVSTIAAEALGPVAGAVPLSGDASTRRFFRLRLADGETIVAMVLEGPIDPAVHPQILVGGFMHALGLPVPRLRAAAYEAGLLLYEDLGDRLLQDEAREAGFGEGYVERLYLDAIEIIVRLQTDGTRSLPAGHPSSACALDKERFLFELGFFREHYVEGLRGLRFGPHESRELNRFFQRLAEEAAAPPKVLCHRDFHSRNLMVQGGRLRMVDFQDARLGPVAYDLASLLRDSYVVLPDEVRDRLLEAFMDRNPTIARDPSRFRAEFDVVSLQRNLKAIGTFAYQTAVAGKDGYLASIDPTWSYVFETLRRLPQFAEVVPILEVASGI